MESAHKVDSGKSVSLLERLFHLKENQTTVRQELLAGVTTFMTMGYVVVVNPRILSEAGMPVEGVLFATCISAAIATLIMGLWANYPIALAPRRTPYRQSATCSISKRLKTARRIPIWRRPTS